MVILTDLYLVRSKQMEIEMDFVMVIPMVILKPMDLRMEIEMDFLKDLRMVIPKQMVIPMGWQKD